MEQHLITCSTATTESGGMFTAASSSVLIQTEKSTLNRDILNGIHQTLVLLRWYMGWVTLMKCLLCWHDWHSAGSWHGVPAVGSVVAAVSALGSETGFVPAPAVCEGCRVRQSLCRDECLPAGLRASLSQVLSELSKKF